MNNKMLLTAASAVLLCTVSCVRNIVDDPSSEGLPVSLSPSFGHSKSDDRAATRVTSTDFEAGDALGLYVVADGRRLEQAGNASDNARMEVSSAGAITGSPTAVYYPDTKRPVSLYSYYPYSASIGDLRAYRFSVAVDQTTLGDYKASDFCYGQRLAVSPSTAAQAIGYSHSLSQVLVNLRVPASIGGKKVSSVSSAAFKMIGGSVEIDLESGNLTGVADRVDSVVMKRAVDVTADASGSTTHFAAVVPAQQILRRDVSSGGLIGFNVHFEDNSQLYYIYYNSVDLNLAQGSANTLNLAIGDNGEITLSGDPTVTAWATVTESGILTQAVNNSFTAFWKLPIKEYEKINRVVLGINDPISGTVKTFETTDFSLNADHSADRVKFKFDFVISQSELLSYPYTIDYVEFFEDKTALRKCEAVVASAVSRRGEYTIGIDAEHVIAVTVGTIENWDDLLYGDITRGVDNDFRVSLIEYPHYADIATLKLLIDGEEFTFNDAACIAGSNQLVATTKDVRFPDANGRSPYKYPFTIEKVSLYNASGALVTDGSYPASIAVSRAGLVTLRMYKGIMTSIKSTVTGFNSSGEAVRPEFGGAVKDNPLKVVYCYGAASDQLSCLDVEKVELLIDNQTVTLSGYKTLMSGSVFAAQSMAPHVNIAGGAGTKPTSYPYYISKITLRKADGTMLFSSELDEPLKVDWYGEITIEIMEKMEAGIPEIVELNGLKWATGNLVANGANGAKIGAPGDGGLYFQYGGLIGYKGGASGDGRGKLNSSVNGTDKFWNGEVAFSENDIAIIPAGYSKAKDRWPYFESQLTGGHGYYYYGNLETRGVCFSDQPNGYDPSLGVGDPCAHYLGGDWRMPTYIEVESITGGSLVSAGMAPWSTSAIPGKWVSNGPQSTAGAWFGPNSRSGSPTPATDIFIPASGCRSTLRGSFYYTTSIAMLWTSTIGSVTAGLDSRFQSTGIETSRQSARATASPVRCVQGDKKVTEPIPPTARDIVIINGLQWTKGNLVAAGSHNARVGAIGDAGLYFQYGGLVGYKGGATGDGTGMVDPELNGNYWGFANAYSANDVAVTPSVYTRPTNSWPNFANQSAGGYGYYYYNTFTTRFMNFQTQAGAKNTPYGIGDPCEVYLGSPWRLPKSDELAEVTGISAMFSWVQWTGETGKFVKNGPPSSRTIGAWAGLNAGKNPNQNAHLFIPASGYRDFSDGQLVQLGIYGMLWSSSVSSANNGYDFQVHAINGVYENGSTNRAYAFPVRCVADIPYKQVTPITDQTVVINGLRWAKGNLVANGANGAKVGEPGDCGLYFQYGSLIGYKGGATSSGVGVPNSDILSGSNKFWGGTTGVYTTNEVAVAPAGYTNQATWPYHQDKASGGFGYYYFNTFATQFADFQSQPNANQPSLGIGDPCAYYLGSGWRLPTIHELSSIMGNDAEDSWVPWSTAGLTGKWDANGPKSVQGTWFGPNAKTGTPTDKTDLFIPSGGYRNASTGQLASVGKSPYLWSSTAYDNKQGYCISMSEVSGVKPLIRTVRAHAFPVRCVQDMPHLTNPPTADQYVEMNGLRWTKGNLVAADGGPNAKVGEPGDNGLYFQYGSLIGYKGGAKGDGVGLRNNSVESDGKYTDGAATYSSSEVVARPPNYGYRRVWPHHQDRASGGFGYYYFSGFTTKYANFQAQPNATQPSLGIGDPCAYYLGAGWRLPKYDELASITGYGKELEWIPWLNTGVMGKWETTGPKSSTGAWFGPNSKTGTPTDKTDLFITASGSRLYTTGAYSSSDYAYLWSSSIFDNINGLSVLARSGNGVLSPNANFRASAHPVRCVQEMPHVANPPTNDQVITMHGLKWAKGNLVAVDGRNCKVGEPGDGGLYFQYGGLVGYKGGANGDGTGIVNTSLENKFWNVVSTYSPGDVAVKPAPYTQQSKWPSFSGIESGGYGYYYYGGFYTKYLDFQTQSNANDPSLGIGDPCAYYLGTGWRLPTYEELSSIAGANTFVDNSWSVWTTASVTGKWVASGPKSSSGAWFGPNSKTGTPSVNADLFVPASGYRYSNAGGYFYSLGTHGYLMTSTVWDRHHSFYLMINESQGVTPRAVHLRSQGYPVRCVSGTFVKPIPTVEVAGTKWATGNLVADGTNDAKVGKPEDGGLYFQFGSLIGWKGGATGDGTGRAATANGSYYVGSSFNAASEVQVYPSVFNKIGNIGATWPEHTTNLYYFGLSTYTSGDLHSFAGFSTGLLAVSGVGDPCRYYLGDTWRLPTYTETKAMTDAATKTYPGTWTTGTSTDSYLLCKFASGAELKFPAVGLRYYSSGKIYYVGDSGGYWSSSVSNSTNGYNSSFSNGITNPQLADDRRYGMPVRCVKN